MRYQAVTRPKVLWQERQAEAALKAARAAQATRPKQPAPTPPQIAAQKQRAALEAQIRANIATAAALLADLSPRMARIEQAVKQLQPTVANQTAKLEAQSYDPFPWVEAEPYQPVSEGPGLRYGKEDHLVVNDGLSHLNRESQWVEI